ncbi:MAG TPA: isoprenylcysteine carboxylmethyltransferase family protein [Nocardioides sp.]|nr:isoprenylcysteine carboxylmethyltransferase family protein [Nocardioides sp.]
MPVVPPPAYAVAGALVQRAVAPERRSGTFRKVAGAALALGSLGVIAAADVAFRRHHTTVNPFDPGRATSMVTSGPYGFTRNPMYVGMAGLLTAHAVGRGGWLTPLPVAAFVAVIDRTQIPAEERAMRANFGEEYDDYRAHVPRWLGRPG